MTRYLHENHNQLKAMRLFRFTHRLSILTLIALGLNGCSSKTQLELFQTGSLPVHEPDKPFISRSWILAKQYDGQVINGMYHQNLYTDIIKDHIDVIIYLKVWKEQKSDYLLHLHNTKFDKISLKKEYLFSYNCFNYLPGKADFFQKDYLFSIISSDIPTTPYIKPAYSLGKKRASSYAKIRSPHFNFAFEYPKDYFGFIHSDGHPYKGKDTSDIFISPKNYSDAMVRSTGMALPMSIPLRYFDYSLELQKLAKKYTLEPVSEFQESSTFLQLKRDTLQLNPAFISSYQQSIEYLWHLYFFEINYNILGDTLICDAWGGLAPFRNHGKIWAWVVYWFSKYYRRELTKATCRPVLYKKETEEFLNEVFIEDPRLFSSYFELILWQLFQPTDFEISDSKGRRRAFTFTSRDYRHEGRYEVKFDLMRPFNFKVSKL